ncbi:hypothetical protein VTO73DRAFT_2506 [Trametes versicolor]
MPLVRNAAQSFFVPMIAQAHPSTTQMASTESQGMDDALNALTASIKKWKELFRSRPAPPPFNNPAADTILRSSGALPMDFRVHRVIMAEASEVFADMFAIPQPPRPHRRTDEDDDDYTLHDLLRLCYPIADPDLRSPYEIRPVLAAAMKYEMVEATTLMKNALRSHIVDHALGVWGAACSLRLQEETEGAALITFGSSSMYIASDGPRQLGDAFSFWQPNHEDAIPPSASPASQSLREDSMMTLRQRPLVDIVCRASDGKEFSSHKAILGAVSPLLQARIVALDAASHRSSSAFDNRNGLPVLVFDEASPVLSALLELCYPVRRSPATDLTLSLQDICALAKAATKYDMGFVLGLLDSAFDARRHRNPMSAFLLASHAGLDDYAYTAERALLCSGRAPAAYGWLPEMEVIAAPAYHELMAKHNAVARYGMHYYDRHLGSGNRQCTENTY